MAGRGRRGARRPARLGRAHRGRARRRRARAGELLRDRRDEASASSSSTRPASRSSSRAARPTRRSRWGCSWPERAAAPTGARRRRRCPPHRHDPAPAARRGRAGLELQHAAPERRVEGVPGDLLRQRGSLEAVRAHAGIGHVLRRARARGGAAAGVLNVVQGLGRRRGCRSSSIRTSTSSSFTGSAATGREGQRGRGQRLAKTCLELGGKNALVVCDDADLDRAVEWALASAFSNAGQRCASASRIVVFDEVYDAFRERLVARRARSSAEPVISEESLERILEAVAAREEAGATVLAGGERSSGRVAPGADVLEDVAADAEISCEELFGPVTVLYRVARSRGRSRSSTTRRTGSRPRSTRRASTARCASPRRCRRASWS